MRSAAPFIIIIIIIIVIIIVIIFILKHLGIYEFMNLKRVCVFIYIDVI